MKICVSGIGRIHDQGRNLASKIKGARNVQAALFAGKTYNRAAVHGARQPLTHTLPDEEKVEKEINEGKKEKDKKRQEVEQSADSHLDNPEKPPTVTDSPGYTSSS